MSYRTKFMLFGIAMSCSFNMWTMDLKTIITQYLHALEVGSYEQVMSLFDNNALVHSPLYGTVAAHSFYKDLFADTQRSRIQVKNMFESDNPHVAAVHFVYNWTLKNGTFAPFECIDVFQVDLTSGKIVTLTIIYDTYPIRQKFIDAVKDVNEAT